MSDTDEVERLKSQKSRTRLNKILLLVSVALACLFFFVGKFARCSERVYPTTYKRIIEIELPSYRSPVQTPSFKYPNYDKTLKGKELVVFNEGLIFMKLKMISFTRRLIESLPTKSVFVDSPLRWLLL